RRLAPRRYTVSSRMCRCGAPCADSGQHSERVGRMRQIQLGMLALVGAALLFARAPADAKRETDPVRRTVTRAVRSGSIDRADGNRYLRSYRDSVRVAKRLAGQRRRELDYVIGTVRRIARGGRLTAGRMTPLFL